MDIIELKYSDYIKVQKIVDRIQSGQFTETDIDILLIKLRDYVKDTGHDTFFGLANYVAHPVNRSMGIDYDHIECFYYWHKLGIDHITNPDLPFIRLDQPLPSYIKKLLLLQVKLYDENSRFPRLKFPKKEIIDFINYLLIPIPNTKLVKAAPNSSIPYDMYDQLNLFISHLAIGCVFTFDMFFYELTRILKLHAIDFKEADLLAQRDKIVISIAYLLHHTKFIYKGHEPALLSLSFDYTTPKDDSNADQIIVDQLKLVASMDFNSNGKEETRSFTFAITGLNTIDWIDDNTKQILIDYGKKNMAERPNHKGKVFLPEFSLTDDFKTNIQPSSSHC